MIDLSRLLILGGESSIAREIDFGIKLNHKELDVTIISQIEKAFVKYNPSAILYLASVDLNSSEKNPSLAYEVNVLGIYNVSSIATKMNIPIIIISTGAIFNGSKEMVFSENDIPKPLNVYGNTKYFSEILLKNITNDYLIIRTGWLFGFKHKKNGFTKFIDKLLIGEDSKITATNDSVGSPTYIEDFIENLKKIISSNQKGVIHLINKGLASAEDVAQECIKITGKNIFLESVSVQEIKGSPIRSKSEALTSKNNEMRSWKEALRFYYLNLKNRPSP